ncbi:MAG: GntR family transcriptional regulator [Oscillospiraceae bacterium]|nr:GntR family transcriptional regulator [Oscillospiraceae bacterium]
MAEYKYSSIVEWARKYIASHGLKPHDRFFTEKELCDMHGVSRQTVRQALMQLESEGMICRTRGSGTFVGEHRMTAPQGGAAKNVGVITTYFSDYIFPHIVTGIEGVLNMSGITMQISITRDQVAEERKALMNMISQGVSGIIAEPSKSALPNPNMDLYTELRSLNIPVVFINAKYTWSDSPCVAMDDEAAGRIVTDYLFECGHRNIFGIFPHDDMQGHKRYSGFMRSISAHGGTGAEQKVLWYPACDKNVFLDYSEQRLSELICSSTGVVCYNDDIAVKLMVICRERGIRVPEDISIVGIDDARIASVCGTPLTTVTHPQKKLGETAAKQLLSMMNNGIRSGDDILFMPELVERESVSKIRYTDSTAI